MDGGRGFQQHQSYQPPPPMAPRVQPQQPPPPHMQRPVQVSKAAAKCPKAKCSCPLCLATNGPPTECLEMCLPYYNPYDLGGT